MDPRPECPFCAVILGGASECWYSLFGDTDSTEVIRRGIECTIILDTAPLARGHVLIVSNEHVPSMAKLSRSGRAELRQTVSDVSQSLTRAYSPPTLLEHGAHNFARSGGACIEHAHLHLVPGDFPILPRLVRDFPEIARLADYEDALDALGGQAYLFWKSPTLGSFGVSAPVCATQYLRRLVAAAAGTPARWNWRDCIRHAAALGIREDVIAAAAILRSVDGIGGPL